jgi:hypothetical protein
MKRTTDPVADTAKKVGEWKVKRDTERALKDTAQKRGDEAEKQVNDLTQRLTSNQETLAKALQDVEAKKTELSESAAALTQALEEVATVTEELAQEQSKTEGLTQGQARSDFLSKDALELKEKQIAELEETARNVQQNHDKKIKEMQTLLDNSNAILSQWRQGVLLHVFGIDNWRDIDVQEPALAKLMLNKWPQLQTVEQAANTIIEGHNTG